MSPHTVIPDGLRSRPIRNLDALEKNFWIPGSLAMLAPRNDVLKIVSPRHSGMRRLVQTRNPYFPACVKI